MRLGHVDNLVPERLYSWLNEHRVSLSLQRTEVGIKALFTNAVACTSGPLTVLTVGPGSKSVGDIMPTDARDFMLIKLFATSLLLYV